MRKNSLLVAIAFIVVAGAAFAAPSPQVPPPPAVTTDKPNVETPAKTEDKVQPNDEINVKSRFF